MAHELRFNHGTFEIEIGRLNRGLEGKLTGKLKEVITASRKPPRGKGRRRPVRMVVAVSYKERERGGLLQALSRFANLGVDPLTPIPTARH